MNRRQKLIKSKSKKIEKHSKKDLFPKKHQMDISIILPTFTQKNNTNTVLIQENSQTKVNNIQANSHTKIISLKQNTPDELYTTLKQLCKQSRQYQYKYDLRPVFKLVQSFPLYILNLIKYTQHLAAVAQSQLKTEKDLIESEISRVETLLLNRLNSLNYSC